MYSAKFLNQYQFGVGEKPPKDPPTHSHHPQNRKYRQNTQQNTTRSILHSQIDTDALRIGQDVICFIVLVE